MTLSENIRGKNQNLHFIRFIAAVMVIFHHAFPLAANVPEEEWLTRLTRGELNQGTVAVGIFFLIGGFLIAKSVERLQNGKQFFQARILRIIPPLVFVTVLTMFLGAFFTSYSPTRYFTDAGTWKYLLNSIFILNHNLPGVFTDNPYLSTVNGALWTLPVEFLCYIACFLIYKAQCFDKKRYVLTIPIVIIGIWMINMLGGRIYLLKATIRPCALFYIGMGYYVYKDIIKLKKLWLFAAIVGFALTILLKITIFGLMLFFPYIIFSLCYGIKQVPSSLGDLGNYSYGMYLWGFPVQQAVVHIVAGGGQMNPYRNFVISLPIIIILGWITYHVTEKPLAMRNRHA